MTSLTRWLPAITRATSAKTALTAVGIAVTAAALTGPAAAQAAPSVGTAKKSAKESAKEKELRYEYRAQENYYYCGPAAARIAASANGHTHSQDDMARKLGTTPSGTNSAEDTTRVLEEVTGKDYKTTAIPGPSATPAEMDRLQADVAEAIDQDKAVIANVRGSGTDTNGTTRSYPGGHYVTVVGYQDEGRKVRVADPAAPQGDGTYWMSTINLAHWIAERGYSS
ncbi:C39 family peptidase [Micromonospora sp. NPDC003197]